MVRWVFVGSTVVLCGLYLGLQWGSRSRGEGCTVCKIEPYSSEDIEHMRTGDSQSSEAPAGGRVVKTESQWRAELTPEQFEVTRKHGTERPFANKYWNDDSKGVYVCVCCGQPLFSSNDKFDSGTGWPSFTRPVDPSSVGTTDDSRLWATRIEVHCSRCDAHLGHVFEDGPAPTGLRYCMNSASLSKREEK